VNYNFHTPSGLSKCRHIAQITHVVLTCKSRRLQVKTPDKMPLFSQANYRHVPDGPGGACHQYSSSFQGVSFRVAYATKAKFSAKEIFLQLS
jgi:hypothetical protein